MTSEAGGSSQHPSPNSNHSKDSQTQLAQLQKSKVLTTASVPSSNSSFSTPTVPITIPESSNKPQLNSYSIETHPQNNLQTATFQNTASSRLGSLAASKAYAEKVAVEAAAAVGENENNNNGALVLINGQISAKNDQNDRNLSNSANQTSRNNNLMDNNLILSNQQVHESNGVSNQQKLNTSSSTLLPTFPNSSQSSTPQLQTPSPAPSSSRQTSSQSTCKCPYHQQVQHPDFQIFSQQSLALKNNGNADQRELYILDKLPILRENYKVCQKAVVKILNCSLNYLYQNKNRVRVRTNQKRKLLDQTEDTQPVDCCKRKRCMATKLSSEKWIEWRTMLKSAEKQVTGPGAEGFSKTRKKIAKEMLENDYCYSSIKHVTSCSSKTLKQLRAELEADGQLADLEASSNMGQNLNLSLNSGLNSTNLQTLDQTHSNYLVTYPMNAVQYGESPFTLQQGGNIQSSGGLFQQNGTLHAINQASSELAEGEIDIEKPDKDHDHFITGLRRNSSQEQVLRSRSDALASNNVEQVFQTKYEYETPKLMQNVQNVQNIQNHRQQLQLQQNISLQSIQQNLQHQNQRILQQNTLQQNTIQQNNVFHRQNLQNQPSSSRQISSHPQIKRESHPSGTSSEDVFESHTTSHDTRSAAETLLNLKNHPYNHVKIKTSADAGIASETPNCSETHTSSSGSPPNKQNMIRVDKVVPVNLKKSSSLDPESLESAGFHLHYTGDKRKIENSNSLPGFGKNARKNSTGKRPPKLDFSVQGENQEEIQEQIVEIPTSSVQPQILQIPENLVLASPNIFGTIGGSSTQIVHILNIPTPQLQLAGGQNAQFVLTNNNNLQQLSLSNNGMITPIIIQNGQLNTSHQLGQINQSSQIINHQPINTAATTASSSSGTLLPQLTGSHQPKIQTGIAQSASQLQHQIQGLTSINGLSSLSSINGLSNGLQSSTQFINTPQLYTIIQSGQIPGITTAVSSGGMTIPQLTTSAQDGLTTPIVHANTPGINKPSECGEKSELKQFKLSSNSTK